MECFRWLLLMCLRVDCFCVYVSFCDVWSEHALQRYARLRTSAIQFPATQLHFRGTEQGQRVLHSLDFGSSPRDPGFYTLYTRGKRESEGSFPGFFILNLRSSAATCCLRTLLSSLTHLIRECPGG